MPTCATYRPKQLPTARHCGSVGVYSESRGRTYGYNYSTKQIAYTQYYSTSSEPSLIHMNGRAYAPGLQRFLSPDPVLQQSHNRYAYCLNNPLRYTDPSGYIHAPAVARWPEGYDPPDHVDDPWGGSSGWARAMTPGMTYGWWAGLPAAAYGPAYYAYFGSDGSRNAPPSSHFDHVYGAGGERGRVEWKYRWESKPGKIQADGGIEVIGYKEWYVEWVAVGNDANMGMEGGGGNAKPSSSNLNHIATRQWIYDGTKGDGRFLITGGSLMKVKITNLNIIGAQINIQDQTTYHEKQILGGLLKIKEFNGNDFSFILFPGEIKEIEFYRFVHEPYDWIFNVSTGGASGGGSDAVFIRLDFFSTWP